MALTIAQTFKLNRLELKLTLDEVADVLGTSKTQLSRYERNLEVFSEKMIDEMYEIYHLTKSNKVENLRKEFEDLYFYLYYEDEKYKSTFDDLIEKEKVIKSTVYYAILHVFSYIVLVQKNNSYYAIMDSIIKISLDDIKQRIKNVENFLPPELLQIYYDYRGEEMRYLRRYDQALRFYDKALSFSTGNQPFQAIINYHRAIVFGSLNQCYKALELVRISKDYFDDTVNINRSLQSSLLKASLLERIGNYEQAIALYEQCLYVIKKSKINISVENIYNDIIWLYLMKEDYEKVINVGNQIIEQFPNHYCIQLYLAWAYYYAGDKKNAKVYMNLSKMHKDLFPFPFYSKLVVLMELIIYEKSEARLELYFSRQIKFYQTEDYQMLLFVYRIMSFYYLKKGNQIKEMEYSKRILDLLK